MINSTLTPTPIHDGLLARDIARAARVDGEAVTPLRIMLPRTAQRVFAEVKEHAARFQGVQPAYSVKTNPRAPILELARSEGYFAEVISPQEREAALYAGFPPAHIIYNGPNPLRHGPVACAFADSVEAFDKYTRRAVAPMVGIRFRPAGIASRFGIERADFEACTRPANLAKTGVSWHVRPEDYGSRTWLDIAEEAIDAAVEFQERIGRPLAVLDAGGGLEPASLSRMLEREMPHFHARAFARLRSLETIIIEPGQGVVTPAEIVLTRVLEVRKRAGSREAILDASYSWFPQIRSWKHRIFAFDGELARELEEGVDTLAGSTCLEYDVLSRNLALPASCAPGDLLAVADVGAYDASMAYSFGRGEAR